MWWRKPLLTLALPLALSACGFHPLYGKSAAGTGVSEELASISIAPLRDRQGQEIHNALIKTITPAGPPDHARYRLLVAYSVQENQEALATDETATRDRMRFDILYRLYEGSTLITTGTFPQIFSYNFLQEHYANVSAQEDIRERVSDQVALRIRDELAIYFRKAAEARVKAAADAAKAAQPAK